MLDLTAQVTSSLLPFPEVTINALGEDEITLDSVLQGKFTIGRNGVGWLACGPHLEAVHAMTGERLSAYTFSGGGEHPPCILAAKDFSWLKRSGLLIGLEEAEGSVLCLYDLGLSRVVKAVVIPGRIVAIEPLVSYGGASTSTQHLHQSLRWFFGIAAVGTDLGHVLLVDLCLDDLACSQSELEASDLQVVTKSPAEIPKLREVSSREGRNLCLQLNGATGVGATALQYISRTNQLAVGFSDGYLHLWNMKTLKKEYHSQLEGGKVPVNAFTFQEPENDPRNCCYLWAVQSSQDLEGDMVSLRLLQLAFSERKCSASGKIIYEGLEYCEERYSQELSGTSFPLRAQATNTRLLSCQTIEKFRPHFDRDDSMNEVASPDTSVSMFCWQVRTYGQGAPTTYIGVFDINRWYHAQMPDSLRAGESLQNCPYLAVWSLDAVMQMVSQHVLLDVVVNDRSLSRGLPYSCPPPEQYFNPTTYNFDATCLLNTGIVHLTCSGYQKETLGLLKRAAPCSSDAISSSYSRCLMSGLLSNRLADSQASNLTREEQLDAILCTAVETSSLGLITGCIKQWTAEEQPGSALNLRYILDWAWNKVVQTKEELDGICAPLFDSSSNFTDPQTMQLLQHSQRLLTNLSTIFHCLLNEAQELTQKGLMGLVNKNMVSCLISKYAQVVLWFCRTGLLPEGSDEDALQISRPFYSHSVISNYYTIRREELNRLAKGKWYPDCLMIDGLVGQCGDRLSNLWRRDEGGTGQYPPPTLHALLDIYLLDNIDEACKHAIVIYLLLDVMYAFSNKEGASVESFPTAFAIPIGLVKLIQGLWLLDHHDHQSAFELLLHPSTSPCQFEWQHERILRALMCQGQHSEALRYFHATKPPIASTSQAKLCISVLLHNRCLTEAWTLIQQHSNRLNINELLVFLYETCQDQGLIKELLKLPFGLPEQDCLEKFLQGTGGLQNRELLMVHYLQQANYIPALQLNQALKMNLVNERDPKLKEQSNTRNSILDQYSKVLPRVQRKLATERAKPYHHPRTVHKEVSRPQPLSTITKRTANEKVVSRAGFINNVLTKIEEVWVGKGASPLSSPSKSPSTAELKSPLSSAPHEPFLGTPITMSTNRKSRLMKLVVQPSCPMPQPLFSPAKPPSSWVSPKSSSKASEFSLLQTPQVVKRARALAASGPVFASFTPQSILRSSLRPTPVATPSASPGRSITPPLRKENRITFIEEAESPEVEKSKHWTNGEAADDEISLLTRGALLSKATCKTWSSHEEEDVLREKSNLEILPPKGGRPSPQLIASSPPSLHDDSEEAKPQLVSSFETSGISVRSTDTTLEFYDAPLSDEQEKSTVEDDDDDVIVIIKAPSDKNGAPQSVVTTEQVEHLQVPEEEEQSEDGFKYKETMEPSSAEEIECKDIMMADKNEEEILIKVCTEQEASMTPFDQESSTYGYNEVIEGSNAQAEEVCEHPTVQNEHVRISECAAEAERVKPSKDKEPEVDAQQEVEPSTDLTEFVQRHLFGDDLSSPLTRSGIHSLPQTSNSEFLDKDEEEEEIAAKTTPVFVSQKSTTSITSSEPTGTDSHSIVSVNDSEELSRPVSGDDEDGEEEEDDEEEVEEEEEEEVEEEEEEEEEDEDSGSEVEIIEEIQGRPPPLVQSTEFEIQAQTHFLQHLTGQEAESFSAENKMAEQDAVGEVVVVRVGTGLERDQDEQEANYVELKPSTTLLVPLELVEGQDALMNVAEPETNEIFQTVGPNDLKTDSQSSFSLTLDLEEDDKEQGLNENNLLSTTLLQFQVRELNDEPETFPVAENVDNSDSRIHEESEERELQEVDTAGETKEEDLHREIISDKIPDDLPDTKPEAQDEKDELVLLDEREEQSPQVPELRDALSYDEAVAQDTSAANAVVIEDETDPVLSDAPQKQDLEMETRGEAVEKVEDSTKETEDSAEGTEDAAEAAEFPVEKVMDATEETGDTAAEAPEDAAEAAADVATDAAEDAAEVAKGVAEDAAAKAPEDAAEVAKGVAAEVAEDPAAEAAEDAAEAPEDAAEMAKGVAEDTAAEAPENAAEVAKGVAEDTAAEAPEDAAEVAKGLAAEAPEDAAEAAAEVAAGAAEDTAAEVAEDTAAEVAEDTAAEVAEDTAAEVAEDTAAEVAEDTAEDTAAEAAAEAAEDTAAGVAAEAVAEVTEDTAAEAAAGAPEAAEIVPEAAEIVPEEAEIVPEEAEDSEQAEDAAEKAKGGVKEAHSKKKMGVLEEQHFDSAPDDQPVPMTPTRRTTRASRTVTFISPVPEQTFETLNRKTKPKVKKADEQEAVTAFSTSPSRSSRRNKQVKDNLVSTPRRITRRTKPETEPESDSILEVEEKVVKPEIVGDNTVSSTTRTEPEGSRRPSQRTPSTRGSKQNREQVEDNTELELTKEAVYTNVVAKSTGRGRTPTKKQAAQLTTPRRSSRRTASIGEDVPQPLEILEELEEEVSATPAKKSSKKFKTEPTHLAPIDENDKHLSPSPTRRSQKSSLLTLSVYPQVKLVPVSIPQSVRKRTKGQGLSQHDTKSLDHSDGKLTFLDSETPQTSPLKMLEDDEKQDDSKPKTRSKKRRTESVVNPESPGESRLAFDPDKTSPDESSFIYSPSRRRGAAKRAESPHQTERKAPVTRSRRKVDTADAIAPLEEMARSKAEEPEPSNAKERNKRATRSKAVLKPALIAEVDLLSPLPTPVDPVPRTQRKTKEADGPTSIMNLRRKRIMDTVLTKPVTRRRKL